MKNNKDLLDQHKTAKRKNISICFKVFLFIGIGSFIIFKSHSLLENTFNRGSISIFYLNITLIVFSLGALFLAMAYNNLVGHLRLIKTLKLEKAKIEEVLDKYGLDFETFTKKKSKTTTNNSEGLLS